MAPSRAKIVLSSSSSSDEQDGPVRNTITASDVVPSSAVISSAEATLSADHAGADGQILAVGDELNEMVQREQRHLYDNDDDDEEILLASVRTNIVQVAQHKGIKAVEEGTTVTLKIDDLALKKNTIDVRLQDTSRVGIVAIPIASKLAPLWKQGWIDCSEGTIVGPVPKTVVGVTAVPFLIHVRGSRSFGRDPRLDFAFPARERKKRLEQEERAREIEKEALRERQRALVVQADEVIDGETDQDDLQVLEGPQATNGAMSRLTKASIKVAPPPPDMLAQLFKEGGNDPTRLPIHPCPPGRKDKTMRTDLMDFQKQGLAWMIKMEHPQLPKTVNDPPTQLWLKHVDEEGNPAYFNVATEETQREKPVLKRGGILADEMGLGKTMQTIALICTDDTGKGVISPPEEPDDRFDDMTLIVCPLSVASNWTVQLHHHVGTKRLNWHLYHGEGRNLSKKQLRKYDVVIATYQTVAAEIREDRPDGEPSAKRVKTDSGGIWSSFTTAPKSQVPARGDDTLHQIKWRRIVLDEGHVIKNPQAKMSIACASLKAERRWILTGTPIINSTNDLGSIIGFLRLCRPLDERSKWQRFIGDGKNHDEDTARRLRAVVASTTLRRTKDMTDSKGQRIVKLPGISYYVHKVKLHKDARELYNLVATKVVEHTEKLEKQRRDRERVQDLLVYLLRLRQLACDPRLCPQRFIDEIAADKLDLGEDDDNIENHDGLTRARSVELKERARNWMETNGPCLLCDSNPPIDPRITVCSHVFCSDCIYRQIDDRACCPVCNYLLAVEHVLDPGFQSETVSVADDADNALLSGENVKGGASAKSEKLIEFLNGTEPGVKSLVFSQWTTHLACIKKALDEAGIASCSFDGSMSQERREALIKEFSTPIPAAKIKTGSSSSSTTKNKKKTKKALGPPTVMLISLKAGALGLNLTCASQVFLMDPWWQASIESQAIDRVWRIGQQRDVKVFQLVAEGTVEDEVLAVQDRKKKLIAAAFSANRNQNQAVNDQSPPKIDSKLSEIKEILGLKSHAQ